MRASVNFWSLSGMVSSSLSSSLGASLVGVLGGGNLAARFVSSSMGNSHSGYGIFGAVSAAGALAGAVAAAVGAGFGGALSGGDWAAAANTRAPQARAANVRRI